MSDSREKILFAREKKQEEIQFLKSSFKALISVKTNIPGNNKRIKIAYMLVRMFKELIPFDMVEYTKFYDGYDGPYFLLGSNLDPKSIKQTLMSIEETHPLGRFIDLDVYDGENSLSREKMRKCYICNKDAFVCNKEGNHTTDELIEHMNQVVLQYWINIVEDIVDSSIMMELDLHPKFGLVTPKTSGSHDDMDYSIMIKAKKTIVPFLMKMFEVAWNSDSIDLIFPMIRKIGLDAESSMMTATNHINAYKGLIFNMGIMVSAYAYVLKNNYGFDEVFRIAQDISRNVMQDFEGDSNTFGMYAYHTYGISGVRGEASKGFPTVKKALKYLPNLSVQSRLMALTFLIAESEDTVLLKRTGDIERYNSVRNQFRILLRNHLEGIEELNEFCIEKGLSFGGSADLLILSIFLKKIKAI
ncbi:MAG: triphosphoribosyl-dephospho-CoA synthase [Bacilli bacterium]|nr:triphosphoribosyl-dephospho-CoA synthase [Bacilli bacterium]